MVPLGPVGRTRVAGKSPVGQGRTRCCGKFQPLSVWGPLALADPTLAGCLSHEAQDAVEDVGQAEG